MRVFLSISLLFFCLRAFSQDFALVGTENDFILQAGDLHQSKITIKNTSAYPLNLAIRVLEVGYDSEEDLPNICIDGNCIQEDGILEIESLQPGEVYDKLSFKLEAGLHESTGILRYLIFDLDNPSSELEQSISYFVQGESPAGIMYQRPDMKISNAYPNPIVSDASIDYSFDSYSHTAKIMVMNLLGNKVMEFELMRGQHNITIPSEVLSNGIYFYTVQLDGKNVATKKIVVRK